MYDGANRHHFSFYRKIIPNLVFDLISTNVTAPAVLSDRREVYDGAERHHFSFYREIFQI